MLDDAIDYAAKGWRVLPLRPRSKIPVTAHGLDDATTDLDQVRAWWTRWPNANIGCKVPDRIVVIDVDPRNGGLESLRQLELELGPLPETATVESGRRDGGRHLYFRRPPAARLKAHAGDGIDVKVNGYMVMPPSVHPDTGQPYRWVGEHGPRLLPYRWVDHLHVPEPKPRGERPVGDGSPLVRFVAQLQPGDRNRGLYWACCRAAEQGLLPAITPDLIAAACATGLTEVEVTATIRSAGRTAA